MNNPINKLRFRPFWRFGLKLFFFGNIAFFRTLRLGLILATHYYQNARIDRVIIFGFRRNLTNYYNLPFRFVFLGVSLISVFSLYHINLSGTLCGRPLPRAPRRTPGIGPGIWVTNTKYKLKLLNTLFDTNVLGLHQEYVFSFKKWKT